MHDDMKEYDKRIGVPKFEGWEERERDPSQVDEKGFVIIKGGRPFWIALYGEKPWAMYWHEHQKSWVTSKELTPSEVFQLRDYSIPENHAMIYHELHCEFMGDRWEWMPEVKSLPLCGGCNVRGNWEHRCHGSGCGCEDLSCKLTQGRITQEEAQEIIDKELNQ